MKALATSAGGPFVRQAESDRARWLLLAVVPSDACILSVYTNIRAAFIGLGRRLADTLGRKRNLFRFTLPV
ncbi:MAG TPA: hypothetical protein VGJ60_03220 [Chloroflexota bacterium]|jgi:hypothetical protein